MSTFILHFSSNETDIRVITMWLCFSILEELALPPDSELFGGMSKRWNKSSEIWSY